MQMKQLEMLKKNQRELNKLPIAFQFSSLTLNKYSNFIKLTKYKEGFSGFSLFQRR